MVLFRAGQAGYGFASTPQSLLTASYQHALMPAKCLLSDGLPHLPFQNEKNLRGGTLGSGESDAWRLIWGLSQLAVLGGLDLDLRDLVVLRAAIWAYAHQVEAAARWVRMHVIRVRKHEDRLPILRERGETLVNTVSRAQPQVQSRGYTVTGNEPAQHAHQGGETLDSYLMVTEENHAATRLRE